MSNTRWVRCAVAAGLLAGWTAACDFVKPTEVDPNAIPSATIDQLFVGNQVVVYFTNGGQLSRISSVWMQQMSGTDRQFTDYDTYNAIIEDQADNEWNRVYRAGGLLDLRLARDLAVEREDRLYEGILKVHEAYNIGTIASIWGDVIYSEALLPEKSACQSEDGSDCPALDEQAAVYAALQTLLDGAIADITSGQGAGPLGNDFNFDGDATCWEEVAYSLKARFYMHWAESSAANYGSALTAAGSGIDDASCNWTQIHSTAVQNSNLWSQFQSDRSTYIRSNAYLVELLDVDGDSVYTPGTDDPRLPIYFAPGAGGLYFGSQVGASTQTASDLNVFQEADFGQPIITCWENYLIIAEAEMVTGTAANASTAMQNALDCQEDYWDSLGFTIDLGTAPDAATIDLDAIMMEKYKAQFLNQDVWSDYKRTCIPALTPAAGNTEIPARLYYSLGERQTNPNVPPPDVQGPIPGTRNDNDPNGC